MDELIQYVALPIIAGLVSYLVYLHKAIKVTDDRVDMRYTKKETEHLIDLKLKPVNDRTIMLEDRLQRLERKIDRILEALHQRS